LTESASEPDCGRCSFRILAENEKGLADRWLFTCLAADASRMMLAMDGFESSQGEVRVDLRSRDIGVAKHELDRAQVGAVFDHVRGATVAQGMRACRVVGGLDHEPHGLAGEGHSSQREKKLRSIG